jgi:mRNA interferase HigB
MAKRRGGSHPETPRRNHLISRKKIREFTERNPGSAEALGAWYKNVSRRSWTRFADVRAAYPRADRVGKFTVFDVGGNKYRIITEIFFDTSVVLIRHVLTHAEYDLDKWKDD